MKSNILIYPITLICSICVFTPCNAQENPLIKKDAKLTLVASEYEFTEGPAVDKDGNVFFTDQPNDRILKWTAGNNSVSTYLYPSGRANGLYFDHKGNLLACADEKNQLWRIDSEKNVTVLVSDFKGKLLNGPNDLWVDPKGGIYFTDPFYKRPYWDHTEPEIEAQRVYYITSGMDDIRIVADDYVQPNGIIGSADGKTLYIADIGDKKTYSYTISDNGSLTNKKLFCGLGSDGMTMDRQGIVYLTGDGVTVFTKNGEQLLHIPVPKKWTANVTFGGPNQNILFITAMDSVYTLEMNVSGVR